MWYNGEEIGIMQYNGGEISIMQYSDGEKGIMQYSGGEKFGIFFQKVTNINYLLNNDN